MKHARYIVFLAFLSLLAAFSCQREELDIQDPHEGQEEVVLTVCDPQAVRLGTRAEVEPVSVEYGPFTVTAEEWPLEAPTRVTEVTTVAGSTVAWGAYNNTAGTLWNVTTATPAAVSGSSTVSTVNTGRYTSATGGPSITYYMANVNNSTSLYGRTGTLSVSSSGATVSVSRTYLSAGVDLVAGTATTSSPSVNLILSHAYARTGTVTLNVPAGMTLNSSSWRIMSRDSSTGYAGTYDIASGSWTSAGALSSTTLSTSSDYYLIPGDYDIELSYSVRLADGTYKSETLSTVGGNYPISLEKGKKNNISATIPDDVKYDLYVAWASPSGVLNNGNYQEVPAHGDMYVNDNATVEARFYTIRNGVLDTNNYVVIPNSQVTWSTNYPNYLSVDSYGVVTGHSQFAYNYVNARATVNNQVYDTDGNSSTRGHVSVLAETTVYEYYFEPSSVTLSVGGTQQFNVKRIPHIYHGDTWVRDGAAEDVSVYAGTWSIDDSSVATQSFGYVRAVSVGSTTLHWSGGSSYNNAELSAAVTVSGVTTYKYRFEIAQDGYRLGVGSTKTFTVQRFTDTYVNGVLVQQGTTPTTMINSNFTWASNNTAVASVNSSGMVTGVSAGSATITATLKSSVSEYSSYSNTTDSATVSVGSWDDDWTVPGTGGEIPLE